VNGKPTASDHLLVWAHLKVPVQEGNGLLSGVPWWGTLLIFLCVFGGLCVCGICGWKMIMRKQKEALEQEQDFVEMY
jgi:hypothetical protein